MLAGVIHPRVKLWMTRSLPSPLPRVLWMRARYIEREESARQIPKAREIERVLRPFRGCTFSARLCGYCIQTSGTPSSLAGSKSISRLPDTTQVCSRGIPSTS